MQQTRSCHTTIGYLNAVSANLTITRKNRFVVDFRLLRNKRLARYPLKLKVSTENLKVTDQSSVEGNEF
jgi:hypothetical protein